MPKLTETEIAIAAYAVALLDKWDWRTGEPLSALTKASVALFGQERNAEIVNVHAAEREYAPNGTLWNNAEVRARALRAVLRFCR